MMKYEEIEENGNDHTHSSWSCLFRREIINFHFPPVIDRCVAFLLSIIPMETLLINIQIKVWNVGQKNSKPLGVK